MIDVPPATHAALTPPIMAPMTPGLNASAPLRAKPGTSVRDCGNPSRNRTGTQGMP